MITLRDRVTIVNAEDLGDDGHGNPSYDWANAPGAIEPAIVQPLTTSEQTLAQETVVSRWLLVLSPVTAATASSRVRWGTQTFEVDGEVQPFPDLRAKVHHHEATLRLARG